MTSKCYLENEEKESLVYDGYIYSSLVIFGFLMFLLFGMGIQLKKGGGKCAQNKKIVFNIWFMASVSMACFVGSLYLIYEMSKTPKIQDKQ
jgi:hypothetical protein